MRITALVPWFGAKRILADTIVQELGQHRAYWEPFCGSMAVLLAKPPSSHETVNDLHGELVNLARVLQDETLAMTLYVRLSRTLCSEALYAEARESLAVEASGKVDLDRAYNYFVVSWLGRSGVAGSNGGKVFAVRWTPGGGHGGVRFRNAVASTPEWHERLRSVVILNQDAFDVLAKIDDAKGTAIYCDPPYLPESRPRRKSCVYEYDFTSADHARLAEALGRFRRARVVVSYYDSRRLDELYPTWVKRAVPITKGMANTGGRTPGAVTAPEVLLLNGPSLAAPDLLFGGT